MSEVTKDSFDLLVDNCIEMYSKLLNNGMALDACRVQGKMRALVLKDERYIRETRAIKASKYLSELSDIDRMIQQTDNMMYADDDGRGGSKMEKDALNMKLKAAQMRRELLSLTAENSEDNEDDGLNFFFTPVTREEMERMKRVEIHHGSSSDDDVLKALLSDNDSGSSDSADGDSSGFGPDSAEAPEDDEELVFLE